MRSGYDRIKRLLLDAPDLTDDLLDELRQAKKAVQEMEARVAQARASIQPTTQAFRMAERAIVLGRSHPRDLH